jgi:hypothetical protein
LAGALAQVRGCASEVRLSMVVLFEYGRKTRDSLVPMRLRNLEEWFGDRHNEPG